MIPKLDLTPRLNQNYHCPVDAKWLVQGFTVQHSKISIQTCVKVWEDSAKLFLLPSARVITKSQITAFCTLSAWVQIAHLLPNPQLVILTLHRKFQ